MPTLRMDASGAAQLLEKVKPNRNDILLSDSRHLFGCSMFYSILRDRSREFLMFCWHERPGNRAFSWSFRFFIPYTGDVNLLQMPLATPSYSNVFLTNEPVIRIRWGAEVRPIVPKAARWYELVQSFGSLYKSPGIDRFIGPLTGWVLYPGRHTITPLWQVMDPLR